MPLTTALDTDAGGRRFVGPNKKIPTGTTRNTDYADQHVILVLAADGTTLIGPHTTAGSLPVVLAGDAAIVAAATQFTRPADTTAYASGDLVANNTAAGSVTPLTFTVTAVTAGAGSIRRARIKKSGTSTTNAQFRLHLWSAAPTVANGDNGAFSASGAATYLGALDVTVGQAFTDGAVGFGVPVNGSEIVFKLASGFTIRGLLEARAAYTPANAETFDVALEVVPV